MRKLLLLLAAAFHLGAADVPLEGLRQPVEILRDRWGVPHIYAANADDLFFAQGYIAARDRLFQIDLWRRVGTGKLAEALGPQAIARDRMARLVRFRGDWNAEWAGYGPDTRQIAVAFTAGINAYIGSLGGKRPLEFRLAGYDPGLWEPEDIVARIAGLLMTRNVVREVQRALDIQRFGLEKVQKFLPPDPLVPIHPPNGLDLAEITGAILRDYSEAIGGVRFPDPLRSEVTPGPAGELLASLFPDAQGSNNWVVGGTLSATGKPLLASDPHRPVQIPSLRKTVHLVAPGWNVIGAGEPALPGVALGHNQEIGFGFTIVGIDQGDLYVEKLNPANRNEYLHRGAWRKMEVVRESLAVRGAGPRTIELRYTVHGPVIHEEPGRHRAYALRWVGAEPGGAGYLAALSVARAKNWPQFLQALTRYKVPSENMVTPTAPATSAGWHPASRRCARTGPACCRSPATPASTNGADSCRSTICRGATIRPSTRSPPPTTTSCPQAIATSSATSGRRRSVSSASGRCWRPVVSSPSPISSACSRTSPRRRRGDSRRSWAAGGPRREAAKPPSSRASPPGTRGSPPTQYRRRSTRSGWRGCRSSCSGASWACARTSRCCSRRWRPGMIRKRSSRRSEPRSRN